MSLFTERFPEASYEGVAFPLANAETDGGHDFAEHTSYGRAGVDNEPTGRKAYDGTLKIPLVNGLIGYGNTLFPDRYQDLITALETHPLGTLVHPTKRRLTVAMISWHEELVSEVQNGLWLTVKWREQNATAQTVFEGLVVAQDARRDPVTQAAETDTAMAAADSTTSYTPVTTIVTAQAPLVQSGTLGYRDVTAAVGAMLTTINANLALAAFAEPTEASLDAMMALLVLRQSVYALRDTAVPTATRARLYSVPRDMAVWQISREVYDGDSTQSDVILAANSIRNAARVPAGTVLTILPLS